MRPLPAVLLPALLLAGCTWLGEPGGSPSGGSTPEAARTVSIYEAVVRRLVTKDHTFGGADPGFRAVYVLDGAVRGAGRPVWPPRKPRRTFSDEVKAGLAAALAELPPVIFVRTRASALAGSGQVERGGVLMTLGPIVGSGRRVEVGASLWLGGRAAGWLTYVVRRQGGAWRVTGMTGPIAIA